MPDQVDLVARLILSTRLPQQPQTLLECILADADLDSLGRLDFLPRSMALHKELTSFGAAIPLKEWYRRQLQFLCQHHYFTTSASQQRNQGKQNNIALLQSLLEQQ
jgi:hypothetical protein